MPLYKYIAEMGGKPTDKYVMPVPSFNVINGGSHAGNRLACQEFMILPVGASSFKEAMQIGAEVYHNLKAVTKKKYGQDACNVGDEGGFAIPVQDNNEALNVLMEAIEKAGHKDKVKLGTDVAASEFWEADKKKYNLDFKQENAAPDMKKTGEEMIAYYEDWINNYPFVSIEDPFDQDDWEAYSAFQEKIGEKIQLVGDEPEARHCGDREEGVQRLALEGESDWLHHGGDRGVQDEPGPGLGRHGVAPLGRDRGHLHRGFGGWLAHWPDQDGSALPLGAPREVQPAPPHRGGAGRCVRLRGRELPQALERVRFWPE